MRLPKPTLVVFVGVALSLLMAASAHAMLKKNAVIKHNRWQHIQCSAGPRTCIYPFAVPTECQGPEPHSTGPNVPSGTAQYICAGWMAFRTGSTGWFCVVSTKWSQYGNFIRGAIACEQSPVQDVRR